MQPAAAAAEQQFVYRGGLSPSERGDDRLAHAEPGVFSAHAGHHGGQRLVQSQLQPGSKAGLGPRPRLRLCHEELQVLDGQAETEVTAVVFM